LKPEKPADPKEKPAPVKKILTSVERSKDEMLKLSTLVKDAIGFNALRGDRVNVINASFVVPDKIEALPEIPIWKQDWVLDIAKQALGVIFVLYLVFGILRPVMRKLATHQPVAAVQEATEDEVDEDQVTLSDDSQQKLLASHEENLNMAKSMVSQDPKLVAQVVKNWVANE